MSDIFAEPDQYDYLPPLIDGQERRHVELALRGELTTAEDVARFVRGGHAIITLQSHKTQNRFTYKITKPEESKGPAAFFVGLLSGPDNNSNYVYIGMIRNDQAGERFTLTKKSKLSTDSPSYKAFEYFWRAVVVQQREPKTWGLSVFHEGRCGRCGRRLTVPESVQNGFGPECMKHVGL